MTNRQLVESRIVKMVTDRSKHAITKMTVHRLIIAHFCLFLVTTKWISNSVLSNFCSYSPKTLRFILCLSHGCIDKHTCK